MISNKDEFAFYLSNNLENIIIQTIKSILLILNHNYTYFKYFILYTKKYKTLFRNLYEIIKLKNRILWEIFIELYGLNLQFKKQLKLIKVEIKEKPEDNYLLDIKKVISNIYNCLLDIIFDFKLYSNSTEKEHFSLLFTLVTDDLIIYKNHKREKKFLFEQGFFFKIIRFIKVIEKYFTDDLDNNNKVSEAFFSLIKTYLEAINNKEIKKNYFKQLFIFFMKEYGNNLIVILNFLDFIYEMEFKKIFLEIEEIEILLNFYDKLDLEKNQHKNNIKLIEKISILIFKILLNLSLICNSKHIIEKLNSYLETLIDSNIIFTNIISELTKIFESLLKNENKNNDNKYFIYNIEDESHLIEFSENIFNFIFDLFKLILKINGNLISDIDIIKTNLDTIENDVILKLLNLLDYIIQLLESEVKQKSENIFCIYCLINLIKFYYSILFKESKILLISDFKFCNNLIKIIQLCNINFIINCDQLFKIEIGDCEFSKTIIELIYDICIQFFINDENSVESYDILLKNYNYIFYDKQFIENKKYSIFYVNDHLNYSISKKKYKGMDNELKSKCNILFRYYNELFTKRDKFSQNFSTYFLSVIIETQKKINNKKEYKNAPISKLSLFLNELFSFILEEHNTLYKLDKKYFFNSTNSNNYNELIIFIKNKYIPKKITIDEVKRYLESNFEQSNKEKNNELINIKKILDDKKIKTEPKEQNLKNDKLLINGAIKSNDQINYFYDLDINH